MTHNGEKPKAPAVAFLVATFFGAGLSPKAPGTAGSLASLVIWAPLVLLDVDWWIRGLVTAGIFALGVWAAGHMVRAEGKEDPQKVVVDEVAGMGLTLLLCAPTASNVVAGFVLFRVFDVWKPWPASLADRTVKGGFGAMLDDMIAAAYALAALTLLEHVLFPRFPWMQP